MIRIGGTSPIATASNACIRIASRTIATFIAVWLMIRVANIELTITR